MDMTILSVEDHSNSERNFCSRDGAWVLKHRIEEYWRTRGYTIEVQLLDQGFMPAVRAARTDIRSTMINGMPTKKSVA